MQTFARVPAPPNQDLQKGHSQTFDGLAKDWITALETLNVNLVEHTELVPSRLQGAYAAETDACHKWIGYIHHKKLPGRTDRPIKHFSRALNDSQRAYNTTHRECHAVVLSLLLLLPYLKGSRATDHTDHNALK